MTPALAAAVSAAAAWLGWRAGALTASGALAAWSVGAAVLVGTGWPGGAVLAIFFLAGSLISRLVPRRSILLDPKGPRRDPWQVYANGGASAVGALAGAAAGSGLGLWIVTASLAAAAADTWATSIGPLGRRDPRLILSGRPVPPGTSGAVSWLGSAGGLVGAVLATLPAWLTGHNAMAGAGAIIGVGGMLADSVLGATLQGRFRCPACAAPSEWLRHRCGTATIHEGGWRWLSNDGVNAAATTAAALAGWAAWRWLSPSA